MFQKLLCEFGTYFRVISRFSLRIRRECVCLSVCLFVCLRMGKGTFLSFGPLSASSDVAWICWSSGAYVALRKSTGWNCFVLDSASAPALTLFLYSMKEEQKKCVFVNDVATWPLLKGCKSFHPCFLALCIGNYLMIWVLFCYDSLSYFSLYFFL